MWCQTSVEEEEEGEGWEGEAGGEDDVEGDEADVALTEAALDAVPSIARFLRASFQPLLLGLLPPPLELMVRAWYTRNKEFQDSTVEYKRYDTLLYGTAQYSTVLRIQCAGCGAGSPGAAGSATVLYCTMHFVPWFYICL